MKSKNKSGQFWEYAGMIIALLVMVSVGVRFINQPEIEEVPAETQRIVTSEKPEQENKQEEKTVLNNEPKKEKLVASSYVKKKQAESKKEQEKIEEIIAELVAAEDTIVDTTSATSVVSKNFGCFGWGPRFPDFKILTSSDNHSESTRPSELLLKDVEILTRNQDFTYIVDGVRVSEETFRSLNPNDIESIDIYKHTDVTNARFGNKDNQSRIGLKNR